MVGKARLRLRWLSRVGSASPCYGERKRAAVGLRGRTPLMAEAPHSGGVAAELVAGSRI